MLTGKQARDIIQVYIDAEKQVQPNGIDLTAAKIESYVPQDSHYHEFLLSQGQIDFDNSERRLCPTFLVSPDLLGWWNLGPGPYLVTYNEAVKIPKNVAGIARPRSSLLRNGATIESSLWDSSYEGKSNSLLVVHNPNGIRIKQNAKVLQIIFFKTDEEPDRQYNGIYQREGLDIKPI